MRVLIRLVLFILIFTLSISLSFASVEPMKVLGRGITLKNAENATIQVACVGDRIQKDSAERSCNKIQFILTGKITDEDAKLYKLEKIADQLKPNGGLFIGPVLVLEDGQKVKKQLSNQLVPLGFMNNTNESLKTGLLTSAGSTAAILGVGISPLSFTIAAVISGILMVSFVAGPAILDPFETRIINSKSVHELQNRASSAWQFKPKKVRAKKFFALIQKLTEHGVSSTYLDGTPIRNTEVTEHISVQFTPNEHGVDQTHPEVF